MKTLPALLLAAALLAHARADDDECRFVTAPVVIQQADNRLFQYWQEPRRAVFDAPRLPDDPALLAFRRAISERIDVDHPALLTAQRGYVNGGDAINVDKVLAATVGTVRKMNCLEALLLATQAARTAAKGAPMHRMPTEFMAYVLTRQDDIKIYYYTVDQAGVGGLGIFNEHLDKDIAEGWRVVRNIHNHNFFPDSERIYGGAVPSAADIQRADKSITYGKIKVFCV